MLLGPNLAPGLYCEPKSNGAPSIAKSAFIELQSSWYEYFPNVQIPTKGRFKRPLS